MRYISQIPKKALIRNKIKSLRMGLDNLQYQAFNQQITNNMISLIEYTNAKKIAFYYSFKNEVDTKSLIQHALVNNKEIYLPVVDFSQSRTMNFYKFDGGTDLIKNKFGIPEPSVDNNLKVDVSDLDLIITPMVAFDRNGYRLGFGGGYYDTLLEKASKSPKLNITGKSNNKIPTRTVGLAFSFQEIKSVPIEPWDKKLNMIITDREILSF